MSNFKCRALNQSGHICGGDMEIVFETTYPVDDEGNAVVTDAEASSYTAICKECYRSDARCGYAVECDGTPYLSEVPVDFRSLIERANDEARKIKL